MVTHIPLVIIIKDVLNDQLSCAVALDVLHLQETFALYPNITYSFTTYISHILLLILLYLDQAFALHQPVPMSPGLCIYCWDIRNASKYSACTSMIRISHCPNTHMPIKLQPVCLSYLV